MRRRNEEILKADKDNHGRASIDTTNDAHQLLADPQSTAPAVIIESPLVVLTYRALVEQIE
jgi:hypothetical protein